MPKDWDKVRVTLSLFDNLYQVSLEQNISEPSKGGPLQKWNVVRPLCATSDHQTALDVLDAVEALMEHAKIVLKEVE